MACDDDTFGPDALLRQPLKLKHHLLTALYQSARKTEAFSGDPTESTRISSVLFILSFRRGSGKLQEPCLILNKRSGRVKQPGDLCCPGGGISDRTDLFLSRMLLLPGSPLFRWKYWAHWRQGRSAEARALSVLLAAALREGFEEMRLNPLRVEFLGPLPPQQLVMFRRTIYPMACFVSGQRRFFPNWEVEKLVYIPIRTLLDPARYARCCMHSAIPRKAWNDATEKEFPCFTIDGDTLWGATYRITMAFLFLAFGFQPPPMEVLPVIHSILDRNYLTGSRSR
ncbi:MAG: hypothetical protein C4530_10020 [Desulfobacteraceae bacterium]|nr:MAG: hypothetical protein C4530_10020 [Desulfobacteraceae bacterium]